MLKPLSQFLLVANTDTDIVNGAAVGPKECTIIFCNQDVAQVTIYLALAMSSVASTAKQFLIYEHVLNAKETYQVPFIVPVRAGDIIRAEASNDLTSVNIFENSL